MRPSGIEPEAIAWEAMILPLNQERPEREGKYDSKYGVSNAVNNEQTSYKFLGSSNPSVESESKVQEHLVTSVFSLQLTSKLYIRMTHKESSTNKYNYVGISK
jgi:hypothetical protein